MALDEDVLEWMVGACVGIEWNVYSDDVMSTFLLCRCRPSFMLWDSCLLDPWLDFMLLNISMMINFVVSKDHLPLIPTFFILHFIFRLSCLHLVEYWWVLSLFTGWERREQEVINERKSMPFPSIMVIIIKRDSGHIHKTYYYFYIP